MSLTPVELRHILHRNPELSFNEYETTRLLIENIKLLPGSDKLKIHTPYKTGLLVEYTVDNSEYILFRADIDALPIKEENEIEYKSQNNFMHACGHDVHTAILYSFIQTVLNNDVSKNILFLFQPAEESGGGASEFFSTGIFDKFKIASAFALHITDEYPEGTIASTSGVLFASSLEVDIEFKGSSAHVAFPSGGRNALNALRQFLDAVDKIPKDSSSPFIFGIGKVTSGEIRNIIPGQAKLEGTIRGLSGVQAHRFYDSLANILTGIKTITGVGFSIKKGSHYPEVIVNEKLFKKIFAMLSDKYIFIDCGYKMTGEDFGFFSQKYPSFMFWLGTSKGEKHGLHNSKFLPRDVVIEKGKDIFYDILTA